MTHLLSKITFSALTLALLSGCGGSSSEKSDAIGVPAGTPAQIGATTKAISLDFTAKSSGNSVSCGDTLTGFGLDGNDTMSIADLRFFVSDIEFYDADGDTIPFTLSSNDFQYTSPEGDVALIDLTGNTAGSCATGAIAFGEGTARENQSITGEIQDTPIAGVRFSTGVPQGLMKDIIANNTIENAPSPLSELYWSWASGYRHFVANFSITNAAGEDGEGYLHLGSRGCGGSGAKALSDKDVCDFVNTPSVNLVGFNPEINSITLDLNAALAGLRLVTPVTDEATSDIIGEQPGASCHSAPVERQPDCGPIFTNFGLDAADGSADAAANTVFSYE